MNAAARLTACRAVATAVAGAAGSPLYALRFELTAPGPAGRRLAYDEPFLGFTLDAVTRDGRRLAVQEAAWNVATRPASLALAPGRTSTLRTPAMLRISPSAVPGGTRFERVIAAARDDVVLHVQLRLPAPFDAPCAVEFE
jgi:hypothetical protein